MPLSDASVALFCENYPPDEGGIAASASRLAHSLSREARVHVFRFPRCEPSERFSHRVEHSSDTLTIHELRPFVNGWSSPGSPAMRARILAQAAERGASILSRESVGVIHGFGLQNAGLVAARAARLLGVPLVQGIRGNDVGRNLFDASRRIPLLLGLAGARLIVCVNQWLAHLLRWTVPAFADRIRVIPNGVEPGFPPELHPLAQLRNSYGLTTSGPVVGHVGTLREKKGPYLASVIAEKFLRPHRGRLLIIGGLDLNHFRAMAWSGPAVDPDVVTVRRARDRRELAHLIQVCDWLIFPSLDDGMANGVLEAMACGRPVVCSPVFSDVVTHGETGLIGSPFRPSDFLNCCALLWDRPGMRAAMGEAARERVQAGFSSDLERRAWMTTYLELRACRSNR